MVAAGGDCAGARPLDVAGPGYSTRAQRMLDISQWAYYPTGNGYRGEMAEWQ